MHTEFYNRIAASTAHRPIRDLLSGMVLHDPSLLPELLGTALDTRDKNHYKACWTAELVFEARIEWLAPHLDAFCAALPVFTNESALRSISKIGLFATQYHAKNPGFLDPAHLRQVMEACFDWLINPQTKVATKAYAMRTLYLIGKNEDWIHPELAHILSEDAIRHSAGYQGAARDILKKIKAHSR